MTLKEKKCVPCEKGVSPMNDDQIKKNIREVSIGWKVVESKKIFKEFPFPNFKQGMEFANKVAQIANEENHHPDICIHYSNVEIELSTHAIDGLSENDFIMAAKIDEL